MRAGETALKVCEVTKDAQSGALQARKFVHQPILGSVSADGPAAVKLSRHLSAGAFLGCGSCTLQGVNDIVDEDGQVKKGVMHYLGYAEATKCGLLVPGAPQQQMLCGAADIRLAHDDQVLTRLWVVLAPLT